MAWSDLPRHRLLDGFLLRLARAPDAEAFALRGGMRIRSLAATRRPVLDADLVCTLPFDPAAVCRRVSAVLADDGVRDGVRFDPELVRADPWYVWPAPGLRIVARGVAASHSARLIVDLRFALPSWPPPAPARMRTPHGEAWLPMCRPEAMIARKLRVLGELGAARWRPKDLADLELLLALDGLDRAALGAAIEATFEGAPDTLPAAVPGWLNRRRARTVWDRFAATTGGGDLDAVVGAVRDGLAGSLGG